jgi:hypothetical protein
MGKSLNTIRRGIAPQNGEPVLVLLKKKKSKATPA